MRVHQDVMEILNGTVLPQVMRIHNVGVPYPAELWTNGECRHRNGTAMFNIGEHGFLTSEYFAYDGFSMSPLSIGLQQVTSKLLLTATGIEIPIWALNQGQKARTMYSFSMPAVQTYQCEIQGWVGASSDSLMRSAAMTLTDLPDLRLYSSGTNLPEKDTHLEAITLRGYETRKTVLTLTAGDWQIQLTDGGSYPHQDAPPLYQARLSNSADSTFTLPDDLFTNSIIGALYKFLSFQSGRWIGIPTIVCAPADPEDWIVERSWVGPLRPRKPRSRSNWTATDWQKWPNLLKEFWEQYSDTNSRRHLNNAIFHYVRSEEMLQNDPVEALATAQSTLQALTRWWTGRPEDDHFARGEFQKELPKAVSNAQLGMDKSKTIDYNQLTRTMAKAGTYRNAIEHGRGGSIQTEAQSIVGCQMHYQNLARLLILAKLGDRDTDQRGNWAGPIFIDKET